MLKPLDYQKIDEVIHSRLRLSILVALATADEMDFTTLLNEVNATKGNLSVQLAKLEESGYIAIGKQFEGKKPVTRCRITKTGLTALDEYLKMVEAFAKIAGKRKE